MRKHLFNDQNTLRNFVNVYVNDEDIRHSERLETPSATATRSPSCHQFAGGSLTAEEISAPSSPSSAQTGTAAAFKRRDRLATAVT
ncbi:MAG: hypothetical protein WKF84_03585 [Pyrinomonadaceae bacterium]